MNPRFWVQRRCFLVNFAKFIMTPILRILSGKKQRQIKLQCLQKVPISTFGSLTHQINSLSSETEIDFSKNWSSYWQNTILCDRSVLYSPFHLSYPYSGWGFSGLLMDRRGGARTKRPPSLKSVTHILQQRWNLAELYLTQGRSKKYINRVTHPLSSADISIF